MLALRRREFITLVGGAAAAWPLAARAQQPERMRRIGVLLPAAPDDAEFQSWVGAFLQGLAQSGWITGRNIRIETRWTKFDPETRKYAAELVALAPDVILAPGTSTVGPLLRLTRTVPIVFPVAADPVAAGLVESLARPGGNATGVTLITAELELKRLEFLREAVPSLTSVALLASPDNPRFADDTKTVREAAQSKGLQVHVLTGRNGSELDTAFATLAQRRIDGLLVVSDPLMISERDRLVALAARHAIPAIYQNRELPTAGGLMSYGTSFLGVYRQLGVIAARILKGAKPADIPVEQPTRIELVTNLKTAKALGLDVPPTLLARADEVIE